MIEVIYKEEKQAASGNEDFFRIPRNIRQIGESRGSHKIYIEDYANTFLEKLAADGKKEGKTAVLVGKINWQEGISYTFIRGAILVEGLDAAPETVAFTEENWNQIEEQQKKYFADQDVVGWFYTRPDLPLVVSDSFRRAHLHYFAGNEKVFYLKDGAEKEEAFYLYENGQMVRQSGYYVYYEKNHEMQEYMIGLWGSETVDQAVPSGDQAVVSFRKIIAGKKEEKEEKEEPEGKKTPVFMYMASACLVISMLAMGINYVNNYQKMQTATEQVRQAASIPKSETLSQEEGAAEEKEAEPSVTGLPIEETQDSTDPYLLGNNQSEEKTEVQEDVVQEVQEGEEPASNTTSPVSEPEPSPAPLPEETQETSGNVHETYTVQFGDSLYKISRRKYGTMDMIPEICELNGISSEDIIYPGEIILLP